MLKIYSFYKNVVFDGLKDYIVVETKDVLLFLNWREQEYNCAVAMLKAFDENYTLELWKMKQIRTRQP